MRHNFLDVDVTDLRRKTLTDLLLVGRSCVNWRCVVLWVIVVSECLALPSPSAGTQLAGCIARAMAVSTLWVCPRGKVLKTMGSAWGSWEGSAHLLQAHPATPEDINTPAPHPCRAFSNRIFSPQGSHF